MRRMMIQRTMSSRAGVLIGLLVAALALLVVVSVTGVASARGNMKTHEGFVNGEVISMDSSHSTSDITLNEGPKGSPANPNMELNVFLNDKTKIETCKTNMSSRSIEVGDKVSISYHEVAGLAVADRISKSC